MVTVVFCQHTALLFSLAIDVMKPLPKITSDSRHYWEGCLNGELRYQFCEACNRAQFPPSSVCTHCHNSTLSWRVSAGLGAVFSFSIVHRAPTPEFKLEAPYPIALVELDEGFRIMVNIRGGNFSEIKIGSRVRIIFESTARDDVKLPQAQLT